MKIFAIGDLHLSFGEDVEKPMDIFGERWVNHAEKLKEKWVATVSPEDIVIICGDISWGLRLEEATADFAWIKELPGKKVLFKGNHDLWWQSTGKLNKLYGDEEMVFVQNGTYITEIDGRKIAICGSRGWVCPGQEGFSQDDKKIYDREILRIRMSFDEGKKAEPDIIVGVLHFPPTNDKLQDSEFTRIMSEYGVTTCVYGHLHGRDAFKNGLQGIFNGVRYELMSLDYLEAQPKEVAL